MNLFGRKPKRKPQKPHKEKTIDQALQMALIRKAKEDPAWAINQALAKYKMVPDTQNPIETHRAEIKAAVYDKVLDSIKKDPTKLAQFENVVLAEILGDNNIALQGDEEFVGEYGGGSDISRALQSIRDMKELQNEMGGNGDSKQNGFMASFFDSEFAKGLGMQLAGLFMNAQGQHAVQPTEPKYIVSIDGKPTEVTKTQYLQLSEQGMLAPVATVKAIEAPKPTDRPIDEETEVPHMATQDPVVLSEPDIAEDEPELPEYFDNIDFVLIESYLDLEPSVFVDALRTDIEDEEDTDSKFLWGFLKAATFEGIIELITPFSSNLKIGNVVKKLLTEEGQIWITDVMNYIKENPNA